MEQPQIPGCAKWCPDPPDTVSQLLTDVANRSVSNWETVSGIGAPFRAARNSRISSTDRPCSIAARSLPASSRQTRSDTLVAQASRASRSPCVSPVPNGSDFQIWQNPQDGFYLHGRGLVPGFDTEAVGAERRDAEDTSPIVTAETQDRPCPTCAGSHHESAQEK